MALLWVRVEPSWSNEAPSPGHSPAPAIRFNTIGYLPNAAKRATIAEGQGQFVVLEVGTSREVFRGRLAALQTANGATDRLTIADFTPLDRHGTYRIEILGSNASREFQVASDLYNWPFYCALRAMYLWRCGTAVTGQFGGETFHHEACHREDAYLDYAGGPAGQRRNGVGGWHDAGDYNKYTVNGAFTAGMMLRAWEQFRDKLAPLKLDLPESDDDMPDFLDEVRWELDWLLKMQAADGRVYHKLSTLKFGGFVLPEKETQRRYFSPWGTAATAVFAAVMAQGARVYQPVDEQFAQQCLAAAEKSYDFLQAHPADHAPDLAAFSTGPYQAPDRDDRLWAAAELWETTGDAKYLRDFQERVLNWPDARRASETLGRSAAAAGQGSEQSSRDPLKPAIGDIDWDWSNVRNLGFFTYLLSQRPDRDPAVVRRLRRDALMAADAIVATTRRHPYGRTLGSKYYWGCNGTVARQCMNLHVAWHLTAEPQYRAAMLDALNYLFGRNPFGRSFVTGLGDRPPLFPHDRRSGGDDLAAPWPGYLVGGPWPKATDWYDVEHDYRTNETAINWNGALIYALAAFVDPLSFDKSVAVGQRAAEESSTTGQ